MNLFIETLTAARDLAVLTAFLAVLALFANVFCGSI